MTYKAPKLKVLLEAAGKLPSGVASTTVAFIKKLHCMGYPAKTTSEAANSEMLNAVYYAFCHHMGADKKTTTVETVKKIEERFDTFSRNLADLLSDAIITEYKKLCDTMPAVTTALHTYATAIRRSASQRHANAPANGEARALIDQRAGDVRLARWDGSSNKSHLKSVEHMLKATAQFQQFILATPPSDDLSQLFDAGPDTSGRPPLSDIAMRLGNVCNGAAGALKRAEFAEFFRATEALGRFRQVWVLRNQIASTSTSGFVVVDRIQDLGYELDELLANADLGELRLGNVVPESPLADEFVVFLAGLCAGAKCLAPITKKQAGQLVKIVRHANHDIDCDDEEAAKYAEGDTWLASRGAARDFWSQQRNVSEGALQYAIRDRFESTWHIVPFIALAAICGKHTPPRTDLEITCWLSCAWDVDESATKADANPSPATTKAQGQTSNWLSGLMPRGEGNRNVRNGDEYASFAKLKDAARERERGRSERPIVEAERNVREQTHDLLDRAFGASEPWWRVALISKRLAMTEGGALDTPEEWIVSGRLHKRFEKDSTPLRTKWETEMKLRWAVALALFYPALTKSGANIEGSGSQFICEAANELQGPQPGFSFSELRSLLEDSHFTRLYGASRAAMFDECLAAAATNGEIAHDAHSFARFLLLTPYCRQTIKTGNGAWFSELPGGGDFRVLVKGILNWYWNTRINSVFALNVPA